MVVGLHLEAQVAAYRPVVAKNEVLRLREVQVFIGVLAAIALLLGEVEPKLLELAVLASAQRKGMPIGQLPPDAKAGVYRVVLVEGEVAGVYASVNLDGWR